MFSSDPEDQGVMASSDWVSQEWQLTESFISRKQSRSKGTDFRNAVRDLVLLSREKMRSYCFQGILLSTQQRPLSPLENLAAFFCSGCGAAPWPQRKNIKIQNTINTQHTDGANRAHTCWESKMMLPLCYQCHKWHSHRCCQLCSAQHLRNKRKLPVKNTAMMMMMMKPKSFNQHIEVQLQQGR